MLDYQSFLAKELEIEHATVAIVVGVVLIFLCEQLRGAE